MITLISNMTTTDWIGILGSFLIASAYLGVSKAWFDASRAPFHLVNLAGALFILLSLYYRPNAGAIVIEVLWALIAISALISIALKRHR